MASPGPSLPAAGRGAQNTHIRESVSMMGTRPRRPAFLTPSKSIRLLTMSSFENVISLAAWLLLAAVVFALGLGGLAVLLTVLS
jgi:hypothetical protein